MPNPIHSRLAPSACHRWSICTASVGFLEENAAILPKESSVYADEGTEAHAYAASLLMEKSASILTHEMETHVNAYVSFVRSKVMAPIDRLYVEKRVPLFYLPEQSGTVDAAIVGPKRIYIADLKYGAGVSVYAKSNKQLASYAESLIQQLEIVDEVPDDTLVTLAIFQPRDRNDPEPVRLWALSRAELREFCAPIKHAAEIIRFAPKLLKFAPEPETVCRWCPGKGICKHYAAVGMDLVDVRAVDTAIAELPPTMPNISTLTREQRQRIIKSRKVFEQWLKAVEDQEVTELLAGAPALEFKLVEGKSNRQWSDAEAAKQLLTNHLPMDVIRPPGDVISPAQAEKALKGVELSTKFENRFQSLITKPPGKPTLVPVGDKRPALTFNAAEGMTKIQPGSDLI